MKKVIALAIVAVAAVFMGCSDSVMPSYEKDSITITDNVSFESQTYSHHETHLSMDCTAAVDSNASIHYDYVVVNGESKLTRTYHHDFADGAATACDLVKQNAANNEAVNCTANAVEAVTEYADLTADDYLDMVKEECQQNK